MSKRAAYPSFRIAERAVISLYDGGVLSPAVHERVIGAFVPAGVDWRSTPKLRSVDDRSLHEIVVSTMLPGASPDSMLDSFLAVVTQLSGTAERDMRDQRAVAGGVADDDDNELLAQLSGNAKPRACRQAKEASARRTVTSPAFNPFLNAALPRKKRHCCCSRSPAGIARQR
ncbi:hypothetical protein [Paraburkholderia sp. GAS199]|uniref:hypothetical protein n=1 Tax=Paraburkholderia sp. GAS199 TaxID=3035126 RepID=UPI003D25EF0F